MAVTIHWASDNAGTDFTQPVNVVEPDEDTTISNGNTTTPFEVWLYHDGTNNLTGCAFYLAEYSGSYTGSASASVDLAELLAWGNDGSDADAFGGYQVNMDGANAFVQAWPTYLAHNQGSGLAFVFNSTDSLGNLEANAVNLHANMLGGGGGSAGVCPANAPNGYGLDYSFQCRLAVPQDEDTGGARQFDLVLKYTYTS